jgi:two-component system, NtrC family, sensor kinase
MPAEIDAVVFQRTLDRERKRRALAETLLEEKSRELYHSFTELESAHAALKENKDQLVQSEKMASLGMMSAGVAHEINNPVGYVSSNLNTLKEYVGVFQQLLPLVKRQLTEADNQVTVEIQQLFEKEDIDFVMSDAVMLIDESSAGLERVQTIVAGLRSFSHTASTDHAPMDLVECLNGALSIAKTQLDANCALICELNDPLLVCGNTGRLSQVFINLVVNAGHAVKGQSGGQIRISTGTDGDMVMVSIEDNGCGISDEDQQKLFQPFFTTKPVGEGTGLGLSISHGIIVEHNGQIECVSEVGAGTTFKIRLPGVSA